MDVEEQERIDSINRYIRGNKPANICRDVGRSKTWLFTWVNRFKNGEEKRYNSQSKAPKNHGRKTGREIENTIVKIRKALREGNEHELKTLSLFLYGGVSYPRILGIKNLVTKNQVKRPKE